MCWQYKYSLTTYEWIAKKIKFYSFIMISVPDADVDISSEYVHNKKLLYRQIR